MSTGSISLDILVNQIISDSLGNSSGSFAAIRRRYPTLSDKEIQEIFSMISSAFEKKSDNADKATLVVTAPPSFAMKTKPTKIVVNTMITNAKESAIITGYSLSEYFEDLIECLIRKSQEGVFIKFFVNDIDNQSSLEKLCRYKGKFLKIYNYPKQADKMSALHAKVISVDQMDTLITSANLSYHGQEGNIELGAQIHSRDLAKQIDEVFTKLVFSGVFVEV